MKITLVRHAETEWNYDNKMQGTHNIELNDRGIRQAKRLKDKLRDKHFDYCYMSPLIRTVQTAIILIGDRVETIPDKRLIELTKLYNSEKTTYATIEFVDIAGLVKGASKGEGLGNQFLANIREVDAIVHVVRCFEDSNIIHVDGSIDPIRDIEVINMELIFADIETLEKRLSKVKHQMNNDKEAKVAMITSAGQRSKVLESLKLGAEKFITKPFDPNLVLTELKSLT